MINSSADAKKIKFFSLFEILFIILLACVPLLFSFPYRVNIFLSWEGAFRLSQGQIPYKDFGMPVGYMYWVIPALFFKIFGAQMITLVKAQVFINIISGLAFRSILKSLSIQQGLRLISVILYCISFSFFNFWPWYNHTVIVYEIIGISFLLKYIFSEKKWIWLSLSALFTFFSFFTKQDGGGIAFIICLVVVGYETLREKNGKVLIIWLSSFIITAFAVIAPLTRFNFKYWFNYGQEPHTSRISIADIISDFFSGSQWIKFYLFIIVVLLFALYKNFRLFLADKKTIVFFILTIAILGEATVLQVTSYTPPDNNIFFHSFAIAFILYLLSQFGKIDFNKIRFLIITGSLVLLWWSGVFWQYFQRITGFFPASDAKVSVSGENIVNRRTYILSHDTSDIKESQWAYTGLKSFRKIYMPQQTVDGIKRLMNMDLIKNPLPEIKVLNMTELTPLAVEIPYKLETGPDVPLWYHLGVSMFNRDAIKFEQKISRHEYDLILFEYIPSLNNFYPFRIHDSLKVHYNKVDYFPAPRRGAETAGIIEVYIKK